MLTERYKETTPNRALMKCKNSKPIINSNHTINKELSMNNNDEDTKSLSQKELTYNELR